MTIVLNGTTGITNDGGYTGDGVVFADTTPANTLVTTTGGNVGIGTSSPGQKLDVVGAGAFNGLIIGANGSDINSTLSGASSVLSFQINSSERGRFDSSGNFLVGTTGRAFNTNANGTQLNSSGQWLSGTPQNAGGNIYLNQFNASGTAYVAYFLYNGTVVGNINVTGSTTGYATSSDYRLKHNITPMTGALAKVAALKPVTYKWKADGSDGEGFIAHELQEFCPQAVVGEKDAVDAEGKPVYQGIDTSFLVATLTAAIQEQQAIITALTARVSALEGTQP